MKMFRTPMAKITSQLFLCGIGCITEENIQKKGITHVLNTAKELKDFQYPADCKLDIHHILMRDSEDEDLLNYLDSCVEHVHSVCEAGGVILVHCVAGVSRSASVCIAYLMKHKDMTLRGAYYYVFNKRPCIFPNFGFWRHLVEYEIQIRGDNTIELLPYVIGMVPDVMKTDAEYRIKLAWMDDLFSQFGCHFLILFGQVLSICLRSYFELDGSQT